MSSSPSKRWRRNFDVYTYYTTTLLSCISEDPSYYPRRCVSVCSTKCKSSQIYLIYFKSWHSLVLLFSETDIFPKYSHTVWKLLEKSYLNANQRNNKKYRNKIRLARNTQLLIVKWYFFSDFQTVWLPPESWVVPVLKALWKSFYPRIIHSTHTCLF